MAKVSIIIPTYNRAKWIMDAVASIRAQTYADWDLVIVDDGSTDNTPALMAQLAQALPHQLQYIQQKNAGVGAARNTGIKHAQGQYIAWLDSDDLWLADHLKTCVETLDANPQVQWVFAAFRSIELNSGKVIFPDSFQQADGKPRRFLSLTHQQVNDAHIVDDPRVVAFVLQSQFFAPLGCSVFRREFFDVVKFSKVAVQEDTILLIQAMTRHIPIAYLNQVTSVVRDHDEHTCARNLVDDPQKHIRIKASEIEAFETLADITDQWPPDAQAAWRSRMANDAFWGMGYTLLWSRGRGREALPFFKRGLKYQPNDKIMKRFYFKARIATYLGLAPRARKSK